VRADVIVRDARGIDDAAHDDAGSAHPKTRRAAISEQPGDRTVRESLHGLDESLHGFAGARFVRVEAGVIGLARFGIVGIRQ